MQKTWAPPFRWVFAAATLLGCFSALQAYRLSTLDIRYGMDIEVGKLLFLNLIYWYVPAILTPLIFDLGHRFRLDGPRFVRAFTVHTIAAIGYSAVHCAAMIGTRLLLWRSGNKMPTVSWLLYIQRQYLTNLDWTLMTYTTIVALSYALHYSRESQARAVKEAQLETRLIEARLRTLERSCSPIFCSTRCTRSRR